VTSTRNANQQEFWQDSSTFFIK